MEDYKSRKAKLVTRKRVHTFMASSTDITELNKLSGIQLQMQRLKELEKRRNGNK